MVNRSRTTYDAALIVCMLAGVVVLSHAAAEPRVSPRVALHSTVLARDTTHLTQVRQVRHLSQQQAARSIPVKITGVVTAFSGWKNSFFFQDSTAGISVDRTDDAQVLVGDEVEVTGTSSTGLFAPLVIASHVHLVRHASAPKAQRVAYDDMVGGAQDSQWIEVQGGRTLRAHFSNF